MPTTSTCRSCGAPIIWAANGKTGKLMPLDAQAVTMFRMEDDSLNRANAVAVAVQVRTSHFATCPDAATWRKS